MGMPTTHASPSPPLACRDAVTLVVGRSRARRRRRAQLQRASSTARGSTATERERRPSRSRTSRSRAKPVKAGATVTVKNNDSVDAHRHRRRRRRSTSASTPARPARSPRRQGRDLQVPLQHPLVDAGTLTVDGRRRRSSACRASTIRTRDGRATITLDRPERNAQIAADLELDARSIGRRRRRVASSRPRASTSRRHDRRSCSPRSTGPRSRHARGQARTSSHVLRQARARSATSARSRSRRCRALLGAALMACMCDLIVAADDAGSPTRCRMRVGAVERRREPESSARDHGGAACARRRPCRPRRRRSSSVRDAVGRRRAHADDRRDRASINHMVDGTGRRERRRYHFMLHQFVVEHTDRAERDGRYRAAWRDDQPGA